MLDGSGGAPFLADVSVVGELIERVGQTPPGTTELDGRGLCLAPGFVDVHSHDDAAVLTHPELEFKLAQGCTSVVVGNCGFGLSPLTGKSEPPGNASLFGPQRRRFASVREYLEAITQARPALNVATLVGHHNLWVSVHPAGHRMRGSEWCDGLSKWRHFPRRAGPEARDRRRNVTAGPAKSG